MKKPNVRMTVVKEEKGFSAHTTVKNRFIGTEGENLDELKENILVAVNDAFEDLGFVYSIDEIKLSSDLGSFFSIYRVLNAKALGERIGMNQSLLAQYIKGRKKPSTKQKKRIIQGIRTIGKELSEVELVE